jgi:uncharacterized OB-fold protein
MAHLRCGHTALTWPDVERSAAGVFWRGCDDGELWFVRCRDCGGADFPPAAHCRSCLSVDLGWEQSLGHGTLYSWTVVWRSPTPDLRTPYAPAIVDLDEGYRMLTNLVGVAPDQVVDAMPVQVEFVAVGGGHRLPCFAPVNHRP